jgi:glycosyltransferase involved in cell wall biosynthesis
MSAKLIAVEGDTVRIELNDKPCKALVIAPQPFFSPRGTPYSVYYRTLVASELCVKIDLLTYGEGEDVDIPGVRIFRIPCFCRLGNVKTGPSALKLLLDGFILLWAIALLVRNRYSFVHAHEESVFFCRFLKPIFRFKLIYDMHSSLPEQLTNFTFTKSKALIWLFKKLEESSLHAADAVVTICPALADYVRGIIDNAEKHLVIENSIFDTIKLARSTPQGVSSRDNADPERIQSSLPEGKRFVVYAGTLEPYQGIGLLIEAFPQVVQSQPDAFLLIVGGTPEQVKHYYNLARAKGIHDNCLFTGRVSQSIAHYYTSIATVLVSPRSAGTNTPLKIYQQLASGIPLVATRIHSHTQVLDDSVAFLIDPEPGDMARGISEALSMEVERLRRATNARDLYEKKYSRQAYVAKMRQLLEIVK